MTVNFTPDTTIEVVSIDQTTKKSFIFENSLIYQKEQKQTKQELRSWFEVNYTNSHHNRYLRLTLTVSDLILHYTMALSVLLVSRDNVTFSFHDPLSAK